MCELNDYHDFNLFELHGIFTVYVGNKTQENNLIGATYHMTTILINIIRPACLPHISISAVISSRQPVIMTGNCSEDARLLN